MTTCWGCKIEFVPKRGKQIYHNRRCFIDSASKWLFCVECKLKFKKKFSKQICCSKKCAVAWRVKKSIKGKHVRCHLSSCGISFYKMQSRIRLHNFCCNEHKITYLKSSENVSMSKGWSHTEDAKNKIRESNLSRDYNKILTLESRKKMSDTARNRVWTDAMRENSRISHIGKVTPIEVIEKIKKNAKYGWKNKSWKGRHASYEAKHIWANKHIEGEKVCFDRNDPVHKCKGRLEASNKDHKYFKKKEDWRWRCKRHHEKYDIESGNVTPNEMQKRFFADFIA